MGLLVAGKALNDDNTAQEFLKDVKTNGELIKDGGAIQESFEDIGIADEVIESDGTTRSLSMEVGLLVNISQIHRCQVLGFSRRLRKC